MVSSSTSSRVDGLILQLINCLRYDVNWKGSGSVQSCTQTRHISTTNGQPSNLNHDASMARMTRRHPKFPSPSMVACSQGSAITDLCASARLARKNPSRTRADERISAQSALCRLRGWSGLMFSCISSKPHQTLFLEFPSMMDPSTNHL